MLQKHHYAYQASRLPMRNWNQTEMPVRTQATTGFQTTYEELKQELEQK